eukprot:GFYU01013694.1.p1 GENE.GFYU01013694.1~~GFYU01013694.1.p1  ORF type:complete len:169 (+),score=52.42 GFYU01013694.1:166-672(+)
MTDDTAAPAAEVTSVFADGLDQRSLYIQRCKEIGINANSALRDAFQATVQPELHKDRYDFHNNYIGDRGLIAVVDALKLDRHYRTLDLSNNGIRNSGVKELTGYLRTHKNLTSLNVAHNQISLEGGQALLQLIRENQALTDCDWSNNRIDVNTRLKLQKALENNKKAK